MVRKIQKEEYLKGYGDMTAQEREVYDGQVKQWLADNGKLLTEKSEVFEARMQNVLQVSAAWNDQECLAFEAGVILLSALIGVGDTWLPEMLYVKSAKRAIGKMRETLRGIMEGQPADNSQDEKPEKDPAEESVQMQAGAAKEAPLQPEAPFREDAGHGDIPDGNNEGEAQVALVPARPPHIDQYVHLLPQKTQEHASLVQGLYRDLEEAREKVALLMNDKTASAADREAWAKKATKCDNTLRKIFDELDAEWAKLVKSGRVIVDDLGNARVLPADETEETEDAELTSEQRARRRDLRKWLTDTRRGNGAGREERVKQWYVNFKEYLTLEGDKAFEDEKIKEAIAHYDIDIEKLKES